MLFWSDKYSCTSSKRWIDAGMSPSKKDFSLANVWQACILHVLLRKEVHNKHKAKNAAATSPDILFVDRKVFILQDRSVSNTLLMSIEVVARYMREK